MSQASVADRLQETPPVVDSIDPPEGGEAVNLILDKLENWLQTAIELLPNFGVALLTILVAWLISKIVRKVFENPMVNYSRLRKRRVDLTVGVSYGDDLERAKSIAVAAVEELDLRDQSRDVELFFEEFGSSSIDLVVRFWIDFARQADYLAARSAAVMAIKRAFDDNDITIPFPIRTLDFGVVGGEQLASNVEPLLREQHPTLSTSESD